MVLQKVILSKIMEEINETIKKLSKRLDSLEKRMSSLEQPQLMYKPPSSQKHESLVETLNYLHNSVECLLEVERGG